MRGSDRLSGRLCTEGPASPEIFLWGLCVLRRLRAPPAALFSPLQVHLQPPSSKMVPVLLLLLPALAGLFGAAEGQAFHLGKCPNPPVQENFDVNKVR